MFEELLMRLRTSRYQLYNAREMKAISDICEYDVFQICQTVKPILLRDPTLLELSGPVTIVGDIHGQFTDLLRWFEKCGYPPRTTYLFLGDYVDRGSNSIEVLCFLLCLKIIYPKHVFLLRGNHEIISTCSQYNFYEDCCSEVGEDSFYSFIDIFRVLPLAAVVNEKVFCVHGGIAPDLKSLGDIRRIRRPLDVRTNKLVTDILWSDPQRRDTEFKASPRGLGYLFGKSAVDHFLIENKLQMIVRAHEYVPHGFAFPFGSCSSVVTVFSAPNYCNNSDNMAAVMQLESDGHYEFVVMCPIEQDSESTSSTD